MINFVNTSSVAVGNGSTDDWSVLQNLLDNNTMVFVDPLVGHVVSKPLTLHSGLTLVGASKTKGLIGTNPTQGVLYADAKHGVRDIILKSLYLKDNVPKTSRLSGSGIILDGTGDAAVVDVEDTVVNGFTDGIFTAALMQSRFIENRQNLQQRDGWHNEGISTSTEVRGNYANGCGRHGVYGNMLNYSSFQACAVDQCGGDAYHFELGGGGVSKGVKLIACGGEQNKGNGIYLDGIGFSLSACDISGGPAGSSCIVINGAGNVNIDNACYLRNGDYAISVLAVPGHGSTQKSIVVVGQPYCYQQNIGWLNDPFSCVSLK